MLIMLGVPQLDSDNKSDWIRLIKACVPKPRKLPSNLLREESVRCLRAICERFESFTIVSPLVRVSGSLESKPKFPFPLKKVQGCISAATAVVREYTTSNPERKIGDENGSHHTCALSEDSVHHHMLIAWTNEARQNFDVGVNSYQIDAPQPRAGMTLQLTNSDNTGSDELPLQIMDTPVPSHLVARLSESTEKSSDIANPSESSTERSPVEAFPENPSIFSDLEIEELASRSDAGSAEPLLDTPSTPSLNPYNGPPLPFTCLPLARDSSFFARNDTLQAVEDHLVDHVPSQTQQHQIASNKSRVCILHGVGGVGKSSIALETAYRTLDHFDYVFWIAAGSENKVSAKIHNIAIKMNILEGSAQRDYSKSLSTFLTWMEQSETRSLLIYDNVECFHFIQGILPSNRNISVIITTRDYIMVDLLNDTSSSSWLKAIEVHPFSLDEGSNFLYHLAEDCFEADDPSACRILASKLSGLPLAIRQVAGLVRRRHLTYAEYLELYEQGEGTVDLMWMSQARGNKQQSYNSSFTKTYEICFHSLSKVAVALLAVISFFDPDSIEESILTSAQRYTELPLEDFPRTVFGYTCARTELWTTSLCDLITKKRRISTHRLVQYQTWLHLSSYEWKAGFQTASFLLLSQWPSKEKFRSGCLGNWPEFDDLQCHVNSLAKVYKRSNAISNPNQDKIITAPDSFVRVLVYSSW